MWRTGRSRLGFTFGLILWFAACGGGGGGCGGCDGMGPIPGAFESAARIDRGAEVRLTQRAFDFIGTQSPALLTSLASMSCGPTEPVPCPAGFRLGGQPRPTTCDATAQRCMAGTPRTSEPVIGFEIDRTEQSGAIICRDDPTDPARRHCFAWLRLEHLALKPQPPKSLEVKLTAQIYTSDLPLRFDPLGLDCIVKADSNAAGPSAQEFVVALELGEWAPGGGRQLALKVQGVTSNILEEDISIRPDPEHAGIGDQLGCRIANIPQIKTILVEKLVDSLGDVLDDELSKMLGQVCGEPSAPPCPNGSTCNGDKLCETTADHFIVPGPMGLEGRLDFASLLEGIGSPTAGSGDVSVRIGGTQVAEAAALKLGVLTGMEVGQSDPSCGVASVSPRLRPGYTAPGPIPATDRADLDFDGTPEKPFMVLGAVSQQLLDQAIWTAYRGGLFCAKISSYDVELVNTGSLAVLMPSLAQLTHSDKLPSSIWPARIAVRPTSEPSIRIGEGKTSGAPGSLHLESPLLSLALPGLELSFAAMIEERWVHLMTMTVDLALPIAMGASPGGQIELVLGDLDGAITNPRVTSFEILAESEADLKDAIPTLLALVVPRLTEAMGPFSLPAASELGGFELSVLGVRGISDSHGGFGHLGLYLDLGFDPSQAGLLSLSVDTRAQVRRLDVPSSAEMAAGHAGGPVRPRVVLDLAGDAPAGTSLEYQVQLDGGTWSPFVSGPVLELRPPELLVQGHHTLLVRGRIAGDPSSLDPTPARLSVLIDSEAPAVKARFATADLGLYLEAFDVVSRENVRLEVGAGGRWREAQPDETGFVRVPEIDDLELEIKVAATDLAGNRREVVMREAAALEELEPSPAPQPANGCTCLVVRAEARLGWLSVLLGLSAFLLGRRRGAGAGPAPGDR